MIPLQKVKDIIDKHNILEKELETLQLENNNTNNNNFLKELDSSLDSIQKGPLYKGLINNALIR